jgi:hypothetical protein
MVTVALRIEPELCGPLSIGTVAVIKLVKQHFEIALDTAAAYVNRCVFDGAEVNIPASSLELAQRFVVAAQALPPFPRVVARVSSA